MSFGENIKRRRKLLDLDRSHMANVLGVSLEAYKRIEEGKMDDTIRIVKGLSKTLHVNYNYLFALDAEDFNNERKRSIGNRGI